MRCHMRDPGPMPGRWVRSVCWSPEHIQEHVELLVSWFSKRGPGAACPGDLLGMQTLAPPHPSESAGLGSSPATWDTLWVFQNQWFRPQRLLFGPGHRTSNPSSAQRAWPDTGHAISLVCFLPCKMGRRSLYPFAETVLHTGPSVCLRNVNPKAGWKQQDEKLPVPCWCRGQPGSSDRVWPWTWLAGELRISNTGQPDSALLGSALPGQWGCLYPWPRSLSGGPRCVQ